MRYYWYELWREKCPLKRNNACLDHYCLEICEVFCEINWFPSLRPQIEHKHFTIQPHFHNFMFHILCFFFFTLIFKISFLFFPPFQNVENFFTQFLSITRTRLFLLGVLFSPSFTNYWNELSFFSVIKVCWEVRAPREASGLVLVCKDEWKL